MNKADFYGHVDAQLKTLQGTQLSIDLGNICVALTICLKSTATHTVGQRLLVRPMKVVQGAGSQLCFRECEKLTLCLSFNYNMKSLDCELLDKKPDDSTPLASDTDYLYGEPHNTVSTSRVDTNNVSVRACLGHILAI